MESNKKGQWAASNEWLYEMAAVAPHKRQCELAILQPARSSVEAATS